MNGHAYQIYRDPDTGKIIDVKVFECLVVDGGRPPQTPPIPDPPSPPPGPPGGTNWPPEGGGPGGDNPPAGLPEGPEPCTQIEPPAYCQPKEPEPCETNGKYPVLEKSEDALNQLWEKQQQTGKEQVGIFVPFLDSYSFQSLDDFVIYRSATQVRFKVDTSTIPNGAIYVHTHPDRSTVAAFGISYENYHRASIHDKNALKILGVDKGFILDEGKILVYNETGIKDTVDRCGY
ncbi:MAG TPA: hypothetical protein VK106_00105 [Balneolaceae bacterium]|nr:hypothetical protein [Balneolaceae bacterium]